MTKQKLNAKLAELGIYTKTAITKEVYEKMSQDSEVGQWYEKQHDSVEGKDNYYRIDETELTNEDVIIALLVENNRLTKSIKNMVLFFTILTIISLVILFCVGNM